jgi:hypothetical protein
MLTNKLSNQPTRNKESSVYFSTLKMETVKSIETSDSPLMDNAVGLGYLEVSTTARLQITVTLFVLQLFQP